MVVDEGWWEDVCDEGGDEGGGEVKSGRRMVSWEV